MIAAVVAEIAMGRAPAAEAPIPTVGNSEAVRGGDSETQAPESRWEASLLASPCPARTYSRWQPCTRGRSRRGTTANAAKMNTESGLLNARSAEVKLNTEHSSAAWLLDRHRRVYSRHGWRGVVAGRGRRFALRAGGKPLRRRRRADRAGLELVAGLRASTTRVDLEARGRWLSVHSTAGYGEYGAMVRLAVKSRPDGTGLRASLQRYGARVIVERWTLPGGEGLCCCRSAATSRSEPLLAPCPGRSARTARSGGRSTVRMTARGRRSRIGASCSSGGASTCSGRYG